MIIVASTSGQCCDCLVRLHKAFADWDQAQDYAAILQAQANTCYSLLPEDLQQDAHLSTFHCVPIEEDD